MANFKINTLTIKNQKTGETVLGKIENVSYLSALPTATEDSADFVSVNNELYVKHINGTTYSYAKVGGGGAEIIELDFSSSTTITIDQDTYEKLNGDDFVIVKAVVDTSAYFLMPQVDSGAVKTYRSASLSGTQLLQYQMTANASGSGYMAQFTNSTIDISQDIIVAETEVPIEINEDTPSLFTVGERLYYKWEREVKVYGVDGIGRESTTLTRTDDNVGLTATSSELQSFFVADTDVVDSNGNHFVKMKKFYMCITQNNDGSQKWQVSSEKVNDDFFLHPFFYDKDGNEIDYAYYGKYKGSVSSNVLKSVSGVSPTGSISGNNYRTYARANGSNEYHQTDWATVLLAQCMFMIVYATAKYDSIFTMRGKDTTTGTNTQTFFGIEDMVGNGFEFVDGITYSGGTCYYKNYVGEYSGVITSGNSISGIPTSSDVYQKNKLYVQNKPVSVIFPQNVSGASSTTYLCDMFYGSTSTQRSAWWGSVGVGNSYGLFCLDCKYSWTITSSDRGARLHTKKIL